MKRLFIFTYPKLTLYVIGIVLAYFIFQMPGVYNAVTSFDNLLYLAIFFGGLLYSAGFSTPVATGFFLAVQPADIYIASFVGAIGALIADFGIFSFIRLSFTNEFKKLKKTYVLSHLTSGFNYIPSKMRTFLVYVFAILVIASPLPDELAVAMLAGFTRMHPYAFMVISYIGNVVGIFILLSI